MIRKHSSLTYLFHRSFILPLQPPSATPLLRHHTSRSSHLRCRARSGAAADAPASRNMHIALPVRITASMLACHYVTRPREIGVRFSDGKHKTLKCVCFWPHGGRGSLGGLRGVGSFERGRWEEKMVAVAAREGGSTDHSRSSSCILNCVDRNLCSVIHFFFPNV